MKWMLVLLVLSGSAAAEPVALLAARQEYESRLLPFRQKLDAAVSERTGKYVAELKRLEDRLATAAQLEGVLVIRAEREAYEKGVQTQGFDPKNQKVPGAARQVRAAFDADLARIRAAHFPDGRKVALNYLQQLEALERKLTTRKEITAAVAVREERLRFQQSEIDPLNPAGSVIGQWSYTHGKGGKAIYIFRPDGTWGYPGKPQGKWKWLDRSKRKVWLDYEGGTRVDEYILSLDGMHMEGHDDSGTRAYMERIR